MSVFRTAFFLALMASLPAYAETTVLKDGIKEEGIQILWDSPQYPIEAKAKAAQGEVFVRQDFMNGQAIGEPSITNASKSSALNEAATGIVKAIKFKSPGTEAEPVLDKFLIRVEFTRDTYITVMKKTCAEFSEDVAYFKETNPELALNKMRIYTLMLGRFYLMGNMKNAASLVKAMPKSFDTVAEQCKAQPAANFNNLLTETVKSNL